VYYLQYISRNLRDYPSKVGEGATQIFSPVLC